MPVPIPLNLVFEDQISEFVMIKLVNSTRKFLINKSYSEGGYGYIKKNIRGFNEGSKGCPFFVLTDLDAIDCPPTLINDWLKPPINPNLIFRVAIKEVESWLLADIEGFSRFTGIGRIHLFDRPEELPDPKNSLLQVVRRCRKRDIRDDIIPKDEFAKIGPNYNGRLGEFVNSNWSIRRAARRSESLRRTLDHLSRFRIEYF